MSSFRQGRYSWLIKPIFYIIDLTIINVVALLWLFPQVFDTRFLLLFSIGWVRLDIRRSTQIKDSDGTVRGNKTRVKVVKNKVAPPFKLAEFDIMYGEGVSKVGEVLDLAVEFDIIKKSGSWFSYDETKLGQGRDAVKQMINDNPDLMDELEEHINLALKGRAE